jgi:peptide deformylase
LDYVDNQKTVFGNELRRRGITGKTMFMNIEVVKIGAPLLRTKVKPVTDFSSAKEHCQLLTSGLGALAGAGLAANQLGIDADIFVAEVRKTELFPDREESGLHVLLNAEIYEHSEETTLDWEGCFSVPGYLGQVPRHSWIKIRYHDLDGQSQEGTITGYLARVFQHEIDHLAGLIYLDRMLSMRSLTTRENYIAELNRRKTEGHR